MATISTVGSGKDYANLQAWWDDVKDAAAADQHAECYAGDLGVLSITVFDTATPTASVHPRIYAADGERHDGGDTASNGAYIKTEGAPRYCILNRVLYLEIDGIHFDIDVDSGETNSAILSQYDDGTSGHEGRFLTVKNCNFRTQGDTDGTPSGVDYRDIDLAYPADPVCTLFNNNFWGNGEDGGTAIQIWLISDPALVSVDTMFAECYYNTSYDFGNNGIVLICDRDGFADVTLNVISTNNAMIDHDNFDFLAFAISGGLFDITRTFSVSADTTADDEGGAGNKISKAAVDCFATVGSDNTPKASGELHNAGTSVSGITDDILGLVRPQGGTEDIGAFELFELGFVHNQTIMIM